MKLIIKAYFLRVSQSAYMSIDNYYFYYLEHPKPRCIYMRLLVYEQQVHALIVPTTQVQNCYPCTETALTKREQAETAIRLI